ncbi:MAG: dienelactone hydrolase family protein [SAR324 cluster bacterium]|nr:dienelactone hydrolase family protein [SAR324 cluster bacterium]
MSETEKKEIKASDLDPKIFELFDEYVHSNLTRREFANRVSKYAVAGLTAAAIVDFMVPKYAEAIQIPMDDPRLKSETVEYDSPKGGGKIKGLLSRPANNSAKLPGIVVVHENRGLNPHIADVARRAGIANFIAIAPDALTPFGGYPGTDDEGKILQKKRSGSEMLEDFIAAYQYLKGHPECSGKIGVVGFCFGGGIANSMAVRLPDLGAAVPFYGRQAAAADVPKIKAPLLIHYAELDKRINAGWPDYEAALKENNKEYTAHIYPGVNHGFHNDSTPRYDKASAELAWKRTIDFFNAKLR